MSSITVQVGDAGCGKTHQLGVRLAAAAEKYGLDKTVVCSLSRTGAKQAARELEMPYDNYATVHGFAHRALGSPPLAEAHINEWNALYPQWELSGGKKTSDDSFDIAGTAKVGDALKSAIHKDGVQPGDVGQFALHWRDWKKQNGYLDFNDILVEAVKNTENAPGNPAVILVDEAQDTSLPAMKLLFHWAKKAQELVLTGDNKQAIFSFMGSDALLFQNVWQKYDPARAPLPQSYRLSQEVYRVAREWQRRFVTTIQGDFLPTADPGFVRPAPAFSQWTGRRIKSLLDEHEGKSVMFLATCGYMLDKLIFELRDAGIPFFNPWRYNQGKWNPLPQGRKNSNTVVDRVVAFSKPSEKLWGENARFWSAQELKAWTAALPANGILSRGGKTTIEGLANDTTDEEMASAFFQWFTPEAIGHIVPEPDVVWYLEKVKGSEHLIDFVRKVIHAQGVPALKERPRVVVGTVHSLKGSESDIVVVNPDISTEAYETARRDPASADEMKRVVYTGLTRAKQGLYLCNADSRTAVKW